MNISEVKTNNVIYFEDEHWSVLEFQKVSRPRFAPMFRLKLKNLDSNKIIGKNFFASEEVEIVDTHDKSMEFSHIDGEFVYFKDLENFNQVPFESFKVGDVVKYLKVGTLCTIKFIGDKLIGVEPPLYVELMIKECGEDSVDGISGKNYKLARCEGGLLVKVPLFLENGHCIMVDTRTGEYVDRV